MRRKQADPFGFLGAINWDVVDEHADEIAAIFEDDDEARMEFEDQSYDRWSAEHAAEIEEAEYTAWARLREEDGMDASRDAYDAHIDALVAASEPD